MTLRQRLDDDMKAALRARESLRLETIRGIRGAVRNKEIEVGGELDEEGILRVIRTFVKQRAEAIEQYCLQWLALDETNASNLCGPLQVCTEVHRDTPQCNEYGTFEGFVHDAASQTPTGSAPGA